MPSAPSPDSAPSAPGRRDGRPSDEGGEQLGRYRLLRKLARGGMAEVYVARSFGAYGFEKTVAIKRILPRYGSDPQFVRMMVDEAKITVLLNHPNVATILELCEHSGDYFIVMEFVPGQSLSAVSRRLRERGERLGQLESCFVVVEMLQGLQAAHIQRDANGNPAHIIHRDVSPQNTLVSFDGHVKLIDFGIARARHRLELTEVGTIKGKLRYLAPEMIDPQRFMPQGDFDHRVDVFAAGIVLWELIAGRTLYQGDDEMAVYDAITDVDAPNLRDQGACDAALARIVAKALARDPAARYLTAEAFADELRAYVYRNDPAFTHKRIAAVLERHFPVEKEDLLALERGAVLPAGERRVSAEATEGRAAGGAAEADVDVKPVRADEPTRTHSGGSGKDHRKDRKGASEPLRGVLQSNGAASAGSSGGSGPRARAPDALRVDPTRPMRGDTPRKRTESAHIEQHERAALSEHREAGQGLADAGPDQAAADEGEVLTAMTLVSRARLLGPGGGLAKRAADFHGGATETAVEDPLGAHEAEHSEAARERAGLASPRTGAGAAPAHDTSSATRRLMLRASLLGAGLAALGLVVLELVSGPAAPSRPATVPVQVTSSAPGATVRVAGVTLAAPGTFQAAPGTSVDAAVQAPGYEGRTLRIEVPLELAGPLLRDVSLTPIPVELVVEGAPPNAMILVDGAPYRVGMRVPPLRPLMLQVSAPGFHPLRRELEPRVGAQHREIVALRPDEAPAPPAPAVLPKEPERRPSAPAPRPAVAQGTGVLVVKTRAVWGQVTIDGKTLEDTTPVRVELREGRHTVRVSHPPKGLVKDFTVVVEAGQTSTRVVDFDD